jgi:general secretion pathway protein G
MVNIKKITNTAQYGFTLIEILIVMAIMATLLSLVAPRYFESLQRSKEQALHHDLNVMREAIDQFYSDKGVYPDSLDELVQKKYLRALPQDPITQSNATWLLIAPENPETKGAVFDIHSGAEGLASDGTVYAEW